LNGEHVTAGALKKLGGGVVLGPDGREVRVDRATRLPSQERSMAKLVIDTGEAQYFFEVTSDHTLLVEDLHTPVEVVELARMDRTQWPRVVSGNGLQQIVDVAIFTKRTEVVEVVFADDGVALAWTLPTRHHSRARARTLSPSAGFVCKGAQASHEDLMPRIGINALLMRQLGVSEPQPFQDDNVRSSRSVGSRPRGGATWFSRGSLKHTEAHPEKCIVCQDHQRHLSDPRAGICRHAEDCRFCHMPHGHYAAELRLL